MLLMATLGKGRQISLVVVLYHAESERRTYLLRRERGE